MTLTNEEVDGIEADLAKAMDLLEKVGRKTCPVEEAMMFWTDVNYAVEKVRDLMRSTHRLRP